MTEPGGFQSPDGEILMLCFTEKDILAKKFIGPKSKLKRLVSRPLKLKKPTSKAK